MKLISISLVSSLLIVNNGAHAYHHQTTCFPSSFQSNQASTNSASESHSSVTTIGIGEKRNRRVNLVNCKRQVSGFQILSRDGKRHINIFYSARSCYPHGGKQRSEKCHHQQYLPFVSKPFPTRTCLMPTSQSKTHSSLLSLSTSSNDNVDKYPNSNYGELERLKQEEQRLASLLASIRQEKLDVLRSRPLSIGVVGFGRFGQFIAQKFVQYSNVGSNAVSSDINSNTGVGVVGKVVAISRSDYSTIASRMGVKFLPYDEMERFICEEDLDVIVLAVSILSFEETVKELVPFFRKRLENSKRQNHDDGTVSTSNTVTLPLMVDVLSVKEHPRRVLLELLPAECDILCTHPMFGPDSARDSWRGQTFVYERTRIDKVVLADSKKKLSGNEKTSTVSTINPGDSFLDSEGIIHDVHENSNAHIEGMDRMERFLSIWEEEGCQMTPLSCKDHDTYAADSQFITHLMGRILGAQGLQPTPIDTRGFQSVLKLIENTNADSFDLFYGLYKFNSNSGDTIGRLRDAMDAITQSLEEHAKSDK